MFQYLRRGGLQAILTIGLLLTQLPQAHASSTILDGVVVEIVDGVIHIRAAFTPYSSVSTAKKLMTRRDGQFSLRVERLSDFMTYYIDEIPVTEAHMLAYLQPGMRVVMMENRKRE